MNSKIKKINLNIKKHGKTVESENLKGKLQNQTNKPATSLVSSRNLPRDNSVPRAKHPLSLGLSLKFSESRDKHKLFNYFPLIRKNCGVGGWGSADSVRNV